MSYAGLSPYGGLVDDAIDTAASRIAAAIKVSFVQGVEEYMASEPIQQKIADAKTQVVVLVVATGVATAFLAVFLARQFPSR